MNVAFLGGVGKKKTILEHWRNYCVGCVGFSKDLDVGDVRE